MRRVVVVVVAGRVRGDVWSSSGGPSRTQDGSLSLPGLSATVSVMRDDHGIPQVYADTADDLFRAQGYVQAQDRFFEMDFRRHVTAGRLSELVG